MINKFKVDTHILRDVILGRETRIKQALAEEIFKHKERVILTDGEIEVFAIPLKVEHTVYDFSQIKFKFDEVK